MWDCLCCRKWQFRNKLLRGMIHCRGCNICITLYRHCIITQSLCELPSLGSPPAYHCCQEGEVAVSWVSRRNLTFLAVFDSCPCSSVNDLLESSRYQCKGSRRGSLLIWQQLAIRFALWFHQVLSVSYAHICNYLESHGC